MRKPGIVTITFWRDDGVLTITDWRGGREYRCGARRWSRLTAAVGMMSVELGTVRVWPGDARPVGCPSFTVYRVVHPAGLRPARLPGEA